MKTIEEINKHIEDALKQWANILLSMNATDTSYLLKYTSQDVMNAVHIVFCVAQNYGIKHGIINENNAEEIATKMHDAIVEMTGIEPRTFYDKKAEQHKND